MMQLKNIALIYALLCVHYVMPQKIPFPEPGNHNLLAADLFHNMAAPRSSENLMFAPLPIDSLLTMSYIGAEGKTAEELRHVLRLGADESTRIAQNFGEFLKSLIKPNPQSKTTDSQLFMASRFYVSDKFKISSEYKKIAEKNFNILAENINFAEGKLSADKINNYVEQQTQNKIKNLLQAPEINTGSNIVAVSGLYFKGKWKYAFDEKFIKTSQFHINEKEKAPIEMMHIKGTFKYADLPELEATVLELPLNDKGLKITFGLPYKIGGLKNLEEKLATLEFNYVPSRLADKEVCAYIPKFQLEDEIDFKPTLEKIGLSSIFSKKAEFPGIFDKSAGQYITTFKQKTLLEIDQFGSEPAASLGEQGACTKDSINFVADHPFIVAVRSDSAIYLGGHLAKI